MNWTEEDEKTAKQEYLLMIGALCETEEFNGEWKGQWDAFERETFNGRKVKLKGDREKYMTYWVEDQKIINDANWNKIEKEDSEDEYI